MTESIWFTDSLIRIHVDPRTPRRPTRCSRSWRRPATGAAAHPRRRRRGRLRPRGRGDARTARRTSGPAAGPGGEHPGRHAAQPCASRAPARRAAPDLRRPAASRTSCAWPVAPPSASALPVSTGRPTSSCSPRAAERDRHDAARPAERRPPASRGGPSTMRVDDPHGRARGARADPRAAASAGTITYEGDTLVLRPPRARPTRHVRRRGGRAAVDLRLRVVLVPR